jgi:hypothetical protein
MEQWQDSQPKKDGKDHMAEYHLHAKTNSRGVGKGAGGHVRYILREGTYAQKTLEQVNGSTVERVRIERASEVAYAESGHMPAWAQTPAAYWDAADQYERANGTVYREIEFALPKELSDDENHALAHEFAEQLSQVSGGHTPYTLAIHRSETKPMLLHCHLMLSDKVNDGLARDPSLWFRRASNPGKDPAQGGAPKTQARIGQDWLGEMVRPLWAQMANAALERAEVDARIDHRTLEARRMEQEALAAQAKREHHEIAARQHARAAEALDRPPEPKKGRVLTHAGPEKASGRAAMVVDFEAAKAARAQAAEVRRLAEAAAERDRQAVERAQERREAARREFEGSHGGQPDTLSATRAVAALVATQAQRARQATQERWTERRQRAAQYEREARRERLVALADVLAKDPACRLPIRQAYLDAGYQVQRQGDKEVFVYPPNDLQAERQTVSGAHRSWSQRKQGLERDRAAEQETRPGIRHPDKPRWQAERERILTQAYNADVAEKMGRWYRVERRADALVLSNKEATVTDYGDRVTAARGNDREVAALVALAQAKGWERVSLTGPAEFQERAARAFIEAGIGLTDARLEQAARNAIEADRRKAAREHAVKAREAALVEQQERETRPGIRHADRSQWAADRSLVLSLQYDNQHTERAEQRGFYCRWMEDEQGLLYERRKDGATFIDQGPVIVAPHGAGHPERDAIALVLYAQGAKEWDAIEITGDETFRLRAAIAAVEEGLTVTDQELTKRAEATIERRERLVALADALAKDQACGLPIRQAYLDAGYQRQQQGDKGVFVYPHDDLLAERKAVFTARQAWDQRKQEQKKVPRAQIGAYGAEYARRDGWKGSFTGAVIAVDEGHVYVGSKGGSVAPHFVAIPKERFKTQPSVGLYATFTQGDAQRPAGWSKVLGKMNGQGRLVRDQEKGKGIGD